MSHAVGRQAASSKESEAGLGTRLRRGHDDLLGEGALVALGEQRPAGVVGLVTGPRRVTDDAVHDDLVAVLVDAGRVAAEDHRQRLLAQPDAAQRPEVVVVEAGGPHRHRGPAVRGLGSGALPHHQAAQRVVGGEGLGVDGEHGADPSEWRRLIGLHVPRRGAWLARVSIDVRPSEDPAKYLATDQLVWFGEVSDSDAEHLRLGLPEDQRFVVDLPDGPRATCTAASTASARWRCRCPAGRWCRSPG